MRAFDVAGRPGAAQRGERRAGDNLDARGDRRRYRAAELRTIVGEVTPDVGDVSVPRGTRIGYLKQDATFTPGNTLIDESNAGRLVEVTPEGQIVWEYFNPVRGGKDNDKTPIFGWAERIDPSYFDPGFLPAHQGDRPDTEKQT